MVNKSMNPGPFMQKKKLKKNRETCPNEPGKVFKILLFCIKNQNVVYSEFEIKLIPLLITFLLN